MKSLRYLILCFFAALLTISTADTASAVMGQYRLSVSAGTAYDMSSGTTAIWTGTNARFFAASGLITFPFTFSLDGVSYTQLQVYTSGVISLGAGTLTNYTTNNLTAANVPVIAPFWDSVGITGTQGGCAAQKVHYKTFGVAPNRVFVIEYKDFETVHLLGSRATFQVRLYEDGKIEYYYKTIYNCSTCGNTNGACQATTASIGFANSATNFYSVTPQGGSSAKRSTITSNDKINIDPKSTPITAGIMYTFTRLAANPQLIVSPKTYNYDTLSPGVTKDLCIKVRNVGTTGQLTFTSATFSGIGASAYSVPSFPPLDDNDSATICIRFAPLTTGSFPATLTIVSNGVDSGTQVVTLNGESVTPTLEVTPIGAINTATKLFRNQRVRIGDSLQQKFLVRNVGGGKLAFPNTSFTTGTYFHYYAVTRLPATALGNGQYDTVGITYYPRKEGSNPAVLNLVNNSATTPYLMDLVG